MERFLALIYQNSNNLIYVRMSIVVPKTTQSLSFSQCLALGEAGFARSAGWRAPHGGRALALVDSRSGQPVCCAANLEAPPAQLWPGRLHTFCLDRPLGVQQEPGRDARASVLLTRS